MCVCVCVCVCVCALSLLLKTINNYLLVDRNFIPGYFLPSPNIEFLCLFMP